MEKFHNLFCEIGSIFNVVKVVHMSKIINMNFWNSHLAMMQKNTKEHFLERNSPSRQMCGDNYKKCEWSVTDLRWCCYTLHSVADPIKLFSTLVHFFHAT